MLLKQNRVFCIKFGFYIYSMNLYLKFYLHEFKERYSILTLFIRKNIYNILSCKFNQNNEFN